MDRGAGSTLQESSAAKREPQLVALLGVVGVNAELAEAAHPIHDRVAMDAEAISRVPDAPAVEQRLKRRDELKPPVGRAFGERAEHAVDEGAHRLAVVGECGEDAHLRIGMHGAPGIQGPAHLQSPARVL